jgi:uncharacterized protein (TIGR02996 family)
MIVIAHSSHLNHLEWFDNHSVHTEIIMPQLIRFDCPFWKSILYNPFDNYPRLIFADYLDEHGEAEFANYIRNTVNGCMTKRDDINHTLWWRSWLYGIPDRFLEMLEWQDGLPCKINLNINRRQVTVFEMPNQNYNPFAEQEMELYNDRENMRVNLKNAETYFKNFVEWFPIREIDMGCCRIFPYFKKMIWYNGDRVTVNGVEEAFVHDYDMPLIDWWRSMNGLLRQPFRYTLMRDDYGDILRGHGNVRLAQCASDTTVRDGRRASQNRRSLVHTVSRNATVTFGDDGKYVCRV